MCKVNFRNEVLGGVDVKEQEKTYISALGCNGFNKPIDDLEAFYNFLLEKVFYKHCYLLYL